MQVSYNAIIREMDAEELQEEAQRIYDNWGKVLASQETGDTLKNMSRQHSQITGNPLAIDLRLKGDGQVILIIM